MSLDMKPIRLSVFLSFLLVLFAQRTEGEPSPPSLPEAIQLLQLETIRGLKQTIREKEDENRKLEEMVKSVELDKLSLTQNNALVKEEMLRTISEKENMILEMETRLKSVEDEKRSGEEKNAMEILERDGRIGELERRIEGIEAEKAAVEKKSAIEKEEHEQRMVAMESEKTQLREEYVSKQTERDATCQNEKREIEDVMNKELGEISTRLHQSQATVNYMSEVMIHSNEVMEEQKNLLEAQASAIQELNEVEVKGGKNCSTLLGLSADSFSLQEETIDLLKSSLVTGKNFSELSTEGLEQLDVPSFMFEMVASYNDLAAGVFDISITNISTLININIGIDINNGIW